MVKGELNEKQDLLKNLKKCLQPVDISLLEKHLITIYDSVKSLREAFPCKLSRVLVNLRTLIKYIHGRHVKYLDRET